MTGQLKFFLYRDDAIVSQYLEQLEGGIFDEESIRRQDSRGGTLGGGVSAGPLSVGGSRSRSKGEGSEFSLRQTGASRFTRFHQLATDTQEVRTLDWVNEVVWDQVRSGDIVESTVTLEVPQFLKSLELVGPVSALIPVFEALGSIQGDDGKPRVDPDELHTVKRQLPVVEQAAAVAGHSPIPIIASLVSSQRFKFSFQLERDKVLVASLSELEGEAHLVASVQSNLQRGRPTHVGQLVPGLPAQSRAQRRHAGEGDNGSITLRYPALIVTAIAVFR
ncbi:MAG: DUF6414 family protein [Candidatus Dormibacteria bacterium]